MKSNADEIVRKKLEDFEIDVPTDCWDAISHTLPQQKRSKTVVFWRRAAVAAIFMAVVSSTALWYMGENKSDVVAKSTPAIEQVTDSNNHKKVSERSQKVIMPSTIIAHSKKSNKGKVESSVQALPTTSISEPIEIAAASDKKKIPPVATAEQPIQEELVNSDMAQIKNPTQKELEEFAKTGMGNEEEQLAKSVKTNHQSSLAWIAALPGTSNTTVNSTKSLRSSTNTKNAVDILNAQQANAQNSGYTQRYYVPLSTAILFNKSLTKRISIETGVRYTYLMSTQQQESSPHFSALTQKLHYLGLPINLNIKLLQKNRFSLYTKTGGLVEKNFAGTWNEEIKNTDGSVFYEERFNELEKVPQWSVNFGVGAQYDIYKWLGLYFEPATAYYFDNGSSIDNIRKRHRFDFSLQAGFRIGL